MRKPMAAAGTAVFFVLVLGVVAGLVPWWLTGWRMREPWWSWVLAPLRVAGAALVAAGTLALVLLFVRFVAEGAGTPAPVAPTGRLVVGGLYRYVRNPMYLAVVAIIVGQALVLGQPTLLLYAAAAAGAMGTFTRLYEEPALARRFGREYEAYRRAVPAWWPHRHPWQQEEAAEPRAAKDGKTDEGGLVSDKVRDDSSHFAWSGESQMQRTTWTSAAQPFLVFGVLHAT